MMEQRIVDETTNNVQHFGFVDISKCVYIYIINL